MNIVDYPPQDSTLAIQQLWGAKIELENIVRNLDASIDTMRGYFSTTEPITYDRAHGVFGLEFDINAFRIHNGKLTTKQGLDPTTSWASFSHLSFIDGTAAAPSLVGRLNLADDWNSGWYVDAANTIKMAVNGVFLARYGATGLRVGTTDGAPGAWIEAFGITEQLRLSFDAANYSSFTIANDNSLTLSAGGAANIRLRIDETNWQTFFGEEAGGTGALIATGWNLVGIGLWALHGGCSGFQNNAVGSYALQNCTTGTNNSAFGSGALNRCIGGDNNVAVGLDSLYYLTSGDNNTGVGESAGENITTGIKNSCFGCLAGNGIILGSNNTNVGYVSGGFYDVSGSVHVGYYAGYYENQNNKLFIDNQDRTSTANARATSLIYGIFAAATANQYLYLNANVRITDTLAVGSTTMSGSELVRAYQNSASTTPQLLIEQASTGDSGITWLLTGGAQFCAGIDNSDNDRFKITYGASLDAATHFAMDATGQIGIGVPVGGALGDMLTIYNGAARMYRSANHPYWEIRCYSVTGTHFPQVILRKSHTDTILDIIETVNGENLGRISVSGVDAFPSERTAAYIDFIQVAAATATRVPTRIDFVLDSLTGQNVMMSIDRDIGVYLPRDNEYLHWGAANDMGIFYDGANGSINTSLVAASDLNITCGANKTLELQNSVYEDLQFPLASGKVPVANFPTWETFTANTSAYAFSVDDYIDVQCNEIPHDWVEGTAGDLHLHFTLKTAQNTGANRFAKFSIVIAYADTDEVWVEDAAYTGEATIPTGSAALKNFYLDMGNITLTNYLIGAQIVARVKRIAATGGTEYADDVYITQVGVHLQRNTMGSRQETIK